MNDERLAELQEKYKDRNLLEELAWGIYANHSGYTHKQNGEFLNWLCLMAYKALKEKPIGQECVNIKMSEEEIKQFKQMLKEHTPILYTITSDTLVEGASTRPQGNWIPVSERLPERYKEVIVTDIETSDTYQSQYLGNGYWECDNGALKNRIIAWMHLPEPYKETTNE